jgi:hypothetical protein
MKVFTIAAAAILGTALSLPIPEGGRKQVDSNSHSNSSNHRYLRRLRKFRPPKHVDIGIRDFRFPQRNIYRKAGGLGDKGVAANSLSSSQRKLTKKNAKKAKRMTNKVEKDIVQKSEETKSTDEKVKKVSKKNKEEKGKKQKKEKKPKKEKKNRKSSSSSTSSSTERHRKKCHKKKHSKCHHRRLGAIFVKSHSSSSTSSHSRSVSLDINFSQEDAAILGSCDNPGIAVHRRHYSRRLRREEYSRSRSRSHTRSERVLL